MVALPRALLPSRLNMWKKWKYYFCEEWVIGMNSVDPAQAWSTIYYSSSLKTPWNHLNLIQENRNKETCKLRKSQHFFPPISTVRFKVFFCSRFFSFFFLFYFSPLKSEWSFKFLKRFTSGGLSVSLIPPSKNLHGIYYKTKMTRELRLFFPSTVLLKSSTTR